MSQITYPLPKRTVAYNLFPIAQSIGLFNIWSANFIPLTPTLPYQVIYGAMTLQKQQGLQLPTGRRTEAICIIGIECLCQATTCGGDFITAM